MATTTPVLILMGSDSDAPVMQGAVDVLRELGIASEMTVGSAHRSPERVMALLRDAPARGVKVFIVGAGAAAHLAGMVAAHTTLPVIAPASGLQRKAAVCPTSVARIGRASGALALVYWIIVSMNPIAEAAREAHGPAEIAFTRTPQRRPAS